MKIIDIKDLETHINENVTFEIEDVIEYIENVNEEILLELHKTLVQNLGHITHDCLMAKFIRNHDYEDYPETEEAMEEVLDTNYLNSFLDQWDFKILRSHAKAGANSDTLEGVLYKLLQKTNNL